MFVASPSSASNDGSSSDSPSSTPPRPQQRELLPLPPSAKSKEAGSSKSSEAAKNPLEDDETGLVRLILHNDSAGCTQCPGPQVRLHPDDLARPRRNSFLEETVAVVTMIAFFGLAQVLPFVLAWSLFAALFLRSTTAAAVLALFALAAALPAGSRWPAVIHSRVWDCWRRRFRYCGVVPGVPYTKPGEQYVFGHFPHTCFPMGSFLSFPLCGDAATGVPGPMQALVATVLLRVPLYKHVFAWLGCHPADKPVMLDLLKENSVGVIVEGVAGIFLGPTKHEERVYLRKRKGFVKAAIQAGKDLVPVYHLGTAQLLTFSGPGKLSRRARASLGLLWGTAGLPLPRRSDIISLVGEPIPVERDEDPSQELIDETHRRFCEALVRLFDQHKHLLGKEWEYKELQIV